MTVSGFTGDNNNAQRLNVNRSARGDISNFPNALSSCRLDLAMSCDTAMVERRPLGNQRRMDPVCSFLFTSLAKLVRNKWHYFVLQSVRWTCPISIRLSRFTRNSCLTALQRENSMY